MQRNWIGKSEGVDIIFKVDDITLSVFTTRPDTLMGVTYVGIAVEHPLAQQAAQKNAALKNFLQQCKQSSVAEADIETQEKVGMNTGLFAIHPVTQEKIPVWVTNFVLMEYGSGAVMAVPAHDERDHAFAEKYHLPIKHIDALSNEDIQRLIIDKKLGKKCVHYRLRDWGISRQRYWGTPIPMVHCEHCGDVPVNEKDLPVLLPTELIPTGKASVLTTTPSFYETTCPTCHQKAHRETDTMDTFMESSWYHARIASFDCTTAILDDRANHWLPVNQYIGGIEHAILHLLYARFIHKVLRDFEFLKSDEPFEKLLTQGMVLKDGAKMSKSKGNVVPPEPMIKKYGADTVRLFMMFASPPEQSLEWSDAGVEGAFRFLKKVWRFSQTIQPLLSQSYSANLQTEKTYVELQQIVQQANQDMERQQFNTVVSASMKLLNAIQALDAEKNAALIVAGYDLLLRLLAPITPHLCDYLWRQWHQQSILKAAWPSVDARALQHAQCDMVIQINGKLRAKITLDATLDEAAIKHAALTHDVIQPLLKDKNVSRVIVIPKRLINIVVS
ncbi:MAG: hypothetical protein ACD_42C00609G0002 [uncultured bacterium]|nr:MAG: hypothetical protein ACD_42C00609G0002 [uncultured bacterium]